MQTSDFCSHKIFLRGVDALTNDELLIRMGLQQVAEREYSGDLSEFYYQNDVPNQGHVGIFREEDWICVMDGARLDLWYLLTHLDNKTGEDELDTRLRILHGAFPENLEMVTFHQWDTGYDGDDAELTYSRGSTLVSRANITECMHVTGDFPGLDTSNPREGEDSHRFGLRVVDAFIPVRFHDPGSLYVFTDYRTLREHRSRSGG